MRTDDPHHDENIEIDPAKEDPQATEPVSRRSVLQASVFVAGGMAAAVAAQQAAGQITTQAIGEEGGPRPSTRAAGEEGAGAAPPQATTLAIGEEGAGPTTRAVGEEAGNPNQGRIDRSIAMADAALKRGDLRSAYNYYKSIASRADAKQKKKIDALGKRINAKATARIGRYDLPKLAPRQLSHAMGDFEQIQNFDKLEVAKLAGQKMNDAAKLSAYQQATQEREADELYKRAAQQHNSAAYQRLPAQRLQKLRELKPQFDNIVRHYPDTLAAKQAKLRNQLIELAVSDLQAVEKLAMGKG